MMKWYGLDGFSIFSGEEVLDMWLFIPLRCVTYGKILIYCWLIHHCFLGGDSVESCIFSICFSNTTACRHCKLCRCCCYQLWIGQWSRQSNYTCIMCLDEKWGNYGHIWGTCIRQCFWIEKFASICIELTFYFAYKRKVVLSHYCFEVRRQRMCQ